MAILAIFPLAACIFLTSNPTGRHFHLTLLARKKILFAIIVVLAMIGFAQTSQPPNAQDVIAYLNQSIDWHRQLTVEEQLATNSTDVLFLNDDHQTANQVLRLSFDFAKADSQLLSGQGGAQPAPATGVEPSKYQSLFKAAASTDNEARQTQDELDSDKAKLQSAHGAERKKLQSTVDELQGELDLVQARAKTLHDILQFVGGASGKGTGGNLSTQIEQLQRSVPELEAENTKPNATPATQAGNRVAQPSGILNLIEDLATLSHKLHSIDQRARATDGLLQTAQQLQAPFMADVTTIAEKGEQLAKQADTSDTGQLEQLRHIAYS